MEKQREHLGEEMRAKKALSALTSEATQKLADHLHSSEQARTAHMQQWVTESKRTRQQLEDSERKQREKEMVVFREKLEALFADVEMKVKAKRKLSEPSVSTNGTGTGTDSSDAGGHTDNTDQSREEGASTAGAGDALDSKTLTPHKTPSKRRSTVSAQKRASLLGASQAAVAVAADSPLSTFGVTPKMMPKRNSVSTIKTGPRAVIGKAQRFRSVSQEGVHARTRTPSKTSVPRLGVTLTERVTELLAEIKEVSTYVGTTVPLFET